MVSEKDLLEGIAECMIGEPTPEKMIRMASYYIVQDHLFGEPTYSQASAPPAAPEMVRATKDTDFLRNAEGKDVGRIMEVMDELMDSMKVLQPRIYDSVMRKVAEI